jgi:hypothetical protein
MELNDEELKISCVQRLSSTSARKESKICAYELGFIVGDLRLYEVILSALSK